MDRWNPELDELTKNFVTEFGELTVEALNWKPNSQTWSVGQCIQHLIVVNESYYPVLKEVKNGTYKVPRLSRIGFVHRFFGKLILDSVKPEQKRKTNTFPIWQPAASNIPADIVTQFAKHHENLKLLISNSHHLIQKDTLISSPANRIIVYKLETAFDIMVAHEKRHLKQAREINHLRLNGK